MALIIIISLAVVCLLIAMFVHFFKTKKKNEGSVSIIDHQTNKKLIQQFNFSVASVDYESRLKILTEIITSMKRTNMFSSTPYLGLSDKEILQDGIRTYELSGEGFLNVYLEKERMNEFNPNAINIMIEDAYGQLHHIGYVPARICKEVSTLMKKYKMVITSSIIGGAYKDITIDDDDKKSVKTFTSPYDVNIHVSFWDNEVDN